MPFATPRPLIVPTPAARVSSQLDLNGGTHFVEIVDSPWWKTASWSIYFEAFSSVEILNRDRWIFGGSSFAVQWGPISLQITDNLPGGTGPPQQLLVYMGTSAGTQNHGTAFTTGSVIVQDTWQKITVTFSAGTLHIWVDGVDVPLTVTAALPASILWGSTNLRIGAPPDAGPANQRFFLGALRNVAMYDHALSPAEVAALGAGESLPSGRTWWGYTGLASHADYVHGNNAVPTPAGPSGPHFTPYMPGDPKDAMTFVGGQSATFGYDYGTMWGDILHSGIPGNTWAAVAPRMLTDAATFNPNAMLVRCGANDLTAGAFPNGRTPEQVRDDTIAAINAAIALPGWTGHLFWIPVPRRGGGAQAAYAAPTETLRGYTAAIAAATAHVRVHLIDTLDLSDSIVIAGNGNTQADTTDGLHLLREIVRAEALRAREAIASVFPVGPITVLPIGDSMVLYSFGHRQALKYAYGVINGRT